MRRILIIAALTLVSAVNAKSPQKDKDDKYIPHDWMEENIPKALLASEARSKFNFTKEMSGIKFEDVKDMQEKWSFVTTTYREDKHELRFMYANAIAHKVFQNDLPTFPEGSMVGKVAYYSLGDLSFPASKVPTNIKRYQVMIKDSKRFKETDGWGYAIFDRYGNAFPENHKEVSRDCHACHKIVEDRDYIFAQFLPTKAIDVSMSKYKSAAKWKNDKKTTQFSKKYKWIYETLSRKDLPGYVSRSIPSEYKKVRVMKNNIITSSNFIGTFSGILSPLLEEARKKGVAVAYSTGIKKLFTIVYRNDSYKGCPKGKKNFITNVGSFEGRTMMAIDEFGEDHLPMMNFNNSVCR